jgi:MarR family transcriptional regulator, organic hydroperoxide resistance regulator
MEENDTNLLECCLFFTANSLARVIGRMGEEEFTRVGMTPSYAFLLTLAIKSPGVSQKALSAQLNIAPSTVSRFVDTLIKRRLLTKEVVGRSTYIFPTEAGKELKPLIDKCWLALYERYCKILGVKESEKLTKMTAEACRKLMEE